MKVDVSKLAVCKTCGAVIADKRLHERWHNQK
jgi:hypothetical protein